MRQVLAAGGALAARAHAFGLAVAAEPQAFRVGYQLLSWGRNYPADWWEGCRALASVGFHGVEGEDTIARLYEGRWDEFRLRMQRLNLRLAALYSTSDLQKAHERYRNLTQNLQAAEFLRAMGARVLVVGGTETHNPTDEDMKRLADTANELGRRVLEEYGIKVGFHPHLGNMIQHREDVGRLMELTDPRYFFLAPDTGHLAAGGSDPVEVFRTYGKRIVHTHFKDFDPEALGFGGRRGRMAPLGQGRVDFPALVRILHESQYDGWIVVEFDGRSDPRGVATANRRYLAETLNLEI